MKSSFVALLAAAVLPFGLAACGGQGLADDLEGYDLAKGNAGDEPLAWNAAAQKVAATVVGHPYLVDLDGHGTSTGLHWTFTYWGDVHGWATVKVTAAGARLLENGHMIDSPMAARTINLKKVKVTVAELATIAARHGLTGRCTHLELTQVLGDNPNPHWAVEYGKKQILVDATTGDQE